MVVHVRVDTETNGIGIAVQDCTEPVAELVRALLQIGQVSQKDGSTVHSFKLLEVINEPLQLPRWIIESRDRVPVFKVANICIQGQDASLLVDLLGKVLFLQERLLVLIIIDELEPRRSPRLKVLVQFDVHTEDVLRIRVVVADGWEYFALVIRETVHDHLSDILHGLDIGLEGERVKIVTNAVAGPEHEVRPDVLSDFFEHLLERPRRQITLVVAPLARSLIFEFRQSTIRSAAQDFGAFAGHAGRVVPANMNITEKCDLDELILAPGHHLIVEPVYGLGALEALGLVSDEPVGPRIRINTRPLVRVAQIQHKSAECCRVKHLISNGVKNGIAPLLIDNAPAGIAIVRRHEPAGHLGTLHQNCVHQEIIQGVVQRAGGHLAHCAFYFLEESGLGRRIGVEEVAAEVPRLRERERWKNRFEIEAGRDHVSGHSSHWLPVPRKVRHCQHLALSLSTGCSEQQQHLLGSF